MQKIALIISLLVLTLSSNVLAQDFTDIAGGQDSPLLSRFKGSAIKFTKTIAWNTYILPFSKLISVGGSKTWKKKLKLQGEINRRQYIVAKDKSPALVYANYLSALHNSSWEVIFSGSGDNELGNNSYEWQYYMFQEGLGLADKFGSEYNFRGDDYAYIAAKFAENNVTYYAAVYIISQDEQTFINQDIIKVKNPDLGLVTAKLLTEKIDQKGHLALDGIYFKTGKATLTEKSIPALQNIATYLHDHKSKNFFIVGHTDNVGNLAANQILSENRAQAVKNELIQKYAVTPGQLVAKGIANLSPILSNRTEDGRAINRRVEIVEQ